MSFRFRDRSQAGRFLADKLESLAGDPNAIVLCLPRGGVPVGAEVAKRLGISMDIFLARKLGAPRHEELALGAIASGGVTILNDEVVRELRISQAQLDEIIARENAELQRRETLFRPERHYHDFHGCNVILVDDGLATGATMRAAVAAIRQKNPAQIIVAVPVAGRDIYEQFQSVADEVVAVQTPFEFRSVGEWYEDFSQTTDDEVRALLVRAARFRQPALIPAGAAHDF